jgi:hypothetical protein
MNEFDRKNSRLHPHLKNKKLDVRILERETSYAWAACGARSYRNTADALRIAGFRECENGNDILTFTGDRPVISAPVDGQVIERPAILEIF